MEEDTVTLPKPPEGYKYRLVSCDYDKDRNKESCRKYREQNKLYYERNKEKIKEQKRLQYEEKKKKENQ